MDSQSHQYNLLLYSRLILFLTDSLIVGQFFYLILLFNGQCLCRKAFETIYVTDLFIGIEFQVFSSAVLSFKLKCMVRDGRFVY